jgi:hypothetical protein
MFEVIGSIAFGYQPQQSVLNPQLGQRQTACMRNISAVQRSHSTLSVAGVALWGAPGLAIG